MISPAPPSPAAAAPTRSAQEVAQRLRDPAPGLLLAGLTIFLGFSGGGFFPAATAIAALVLCVALVLRLMLSERPLAGVSPALVVALALLSAFAVWTLLSAGWSDASGRALLEFDRALLYVLTLAFFGTLAPGVRRLRWAVGGLAVAAVVVGGSGLVTRVAADVWPIAANVGAERLSYPVTYWNALGLLVALGALACIALTTSERAPRAARVLTAAATPALLATLLLTFSRGAIVLLPIGIVLYAVLARPRGLGTGLLATVLPSAVALLFTYRADLLATEGFDSPAAIAQGHELALVLAACAVAAGGLRALLVPLDARERTPGITPSSQSAKAVVAAATLVAVLVATVAFDVPASAERQWDRFVAGGSVSQANRDTRSRLTDASNNGRLEHWKVTLDAFERDRIVGNGAGTYQLLWAREKPYDFPVNDGHSLYVEVLGELGIVGLALLGGALLALLVGAGRRSSRPPRHLRAAVIALAAIWLVRAGVDWDWEMPVVTLWLFALGGMAVAGTRRAGDQRAAPAPFRLVRVVAALGVLVLAVTPAVTVMSQVRLDDAVAAFERGDCSAAIDSALGSIDALRLRAEPYTIIGYCDIRRGETDLALQAMRNAVERDPGNWETHYGLALVRAAAGLDPRTQAATALRLNPLEQRARDAVRLFRGDDPRKCARRALEARLPID
ncbi:MAG: O-antigen ligase family protein [Thermoleophilaceae bacterium]